MRVHAYITYWNKSNNVNENRISHARRHLELILMGSQLHPVEPNRQIVSSLGEANTNAEKRSNCAKHIFFPKVLAMDG